MASIAVAAFTKFGDRLAEYLVHRQVATFKHGLETQIEQLRARLAHLGDRGMRSNELEYAAIIAAWEHFVDAYLATYNCIVAFMSVPDFKRMRDEEVTEYLESTDLSEAQRKQVLAASDRNQMYGKVVQLRLIWKAGTAIFDARSVLRKQGIFIPKELENEFEKALQMFSEAQIQRHMKFDYGRADAKTDKVQTFFKDGQPIVDQIKAKVRTRILLRDGGT